MSLIMQVADGMEENLSHVPEEAWRIVFCRQITGWGCESTKQEAQSGKFKCGLPRLYGL